MVLEASALDAREYLKTLLGDSAFLVNGMSSNAEFHFRVLIEGMAKAEPSGRQIDVLQIEHAGVTDEAHPPVSLDVRVGRDWQVFYYIDAVWTHEVMGLAVPEGIGRLSVRMMKIEAVDTEFLLCLCDPAFQYVDPPMDNRKRT